MVVFDATMLSLFLRPGSPGPLDPATGERVTHADLRVAALVEALAKNKTAIIVPTPILSEVLIKAGVNGPRILATLQRSSAFRVMSFDARAAIELAQMTNDLASNADKRAAINAPWSKIKFDRQVVAIARVNRASAIYTDDLGLIAFADLNDIRCVRVADLPVPPSALQGQLPFDEAAQSETPSDGKEDG
jgi:hypothetical protein